MTDWWMLLLPFLISLVLTPLVKRYSVPALTYAKENHRTVHHGKVSRIGGVAIYVAFMVTAALYIKTDTALFGILLGGTIMFFAGLVDDLIDIKPMVKLALEGVAALVLIGSGVQIDVLRLPFGITINFGIVSFLFTMVWIAGITNAVNLIDGLDGLAGGMSVVILVITGSLAIIDRRPDVVNLCFILAAATFGFLVYNAYPASIFMGDCGSLFLGFMISGISLVGFKSSTVMTLALPILLLMIPIVDTLSAILRRTLKGMKFSQADKSHIHHLLMKHYGHPWTVLIMCGLTALFGLSAYVYLLNRNMGFLVMLMILFAVELFIESSAMISERYHPMIGAWHRVQRLKNRLTKEKKAKETKEEEETKAEE